MNAVQYEKHLEVLVEVTNERLAQEEKWGQQDHNDFAWMTILGEEYGEACEAALKAHPDMDEHLAAISYHLRAELIQIAAVAVAHIEAIDRRKKR